MKEKSYKRRKKTSGSFPYSYHVIKKVENSNVNQLTVDASLLPVAMNLMSENAINNSTLHSETETSLAMNESSSVPVNKGSTAAGVGIASAGTLILLASVAILIARRRRKTTCQDDGESLDGAAEYDNRNV